MVLGEPDAGKSTFSLLCARHAFQSARRVAYLDADLGQSRLGPPTTLGVGLVQAPDWTPSPQAAGALWFVGSPSPQGFLLQTAVGVKRMFEAACAAGAELVIVDTCGWTRGPAAAALKQAKFQLLQPRHVVALQRAQELEHLLAPLRFRREISIHRLRPSPRARQRDHPERREYRNALYRRYLSNATVQSVPWSQIVCPELGIAGSPLPEHVCNVAAATLGLEVVRGYDSGSELVFLAEPPFGAANDRSLASAFPRDPTRVIDLAEAENLLLGVSEGRGELQQVAVLRGWSLRERTLRLQAPLPLALPATLALGSVRLDAGFNESTH